jgi:hypothetical protein
MASPYDVMVSIMVRENMIDGTLRSEGAEVHEPWNEPVGNTTPKSDVPAKV